MGFALVEAVIWHPQPEHCASGAAPVPPKATRGRVEGDHPAQSSLMLLVTSHHPQGQDKASWAPLAAREQWDQGISQHPALKNRDSPPKTSIRKPSAPTGPLLLLPRMDHGPHPSLPGQGLLCYLCHKVPKGRRLEKPKPHRHLCV